MATVTISITSPSGSPTATLTLADADVPRLISTHAALLPPGATNTQAFQLMVRRMMERVIADVRAHEASQASVTSLTFSGVP